MEKKVLILSVSDTNKYLYCKYLMQKNHLYFQYLLYTSFSYVVRIYIYIIYIPTAIKLDNISKSNWIFVNKGFIEQSWNYSVFYSGPKCLSISFSITNTLTKSFNFCCFLYIMFKIKGLELTLCIKNISMLNMFTFDAF